MKPKEKQHENSAQRERDYKKTEKDQAWWLTPEIPAPVAMWKDDHG
jgi:hypothetical protein